MINTLKENHQLALAQALEKAAPADRAAIEKQLCAVNWEELSRLIRDYVFQKPETEVKDEDVVSLFPAVGGG